MCFFKSTVRKLIDLGNTVDIACNEEEFSVPDCYREWGCRVYGMTWVRHPLSGSNFTATSRLKKIIAENGYDIVHCHTPVAGACARIACRKFRKDGLRVFYTAHGFHFYKGAPLANRLIFYPIEKFCSRFTDTLITINLEDFESAKKRLKASRTEYVPGVGIDIEKFRNTSIDVPEYRNKIGVPRDALMLLSVGELNSNKNHETVIKALSSISDRDYHYVIAGDGILRNSLPEIAEKLGVSKRVHFLGQRDDVEKLYKCADVYVHPSFREGLPVSLLEAKASGLPAVIADTRGCRDLFNPDADVICPAGNSSSFARGIELVAAELEKRRDAAITADLSLYGENEINSKVLSLYETAD